MTRDAEIQQFKQSLEKQFDAFLKNRAADIGDRSQWLPSLRLGRTTPKVELNITRGARQVSFSLQFVPQNLSEEEKEDLQEFLRALGTQRGLRDVYPNRLSSSVIEAAKTGDEEAWTQITQRHEKQFLSYAEKLKSKHMKHLLLEPEDLLNKALWEVYAECRKGQFKNHPVQEVQKRLFWLANRPLVYSLRRQAEGQDLDQVPWPERAAHLQTTLEDINEIIERAKKRMGKRQREVLSLLASHEEGLNGNQIAELLGIKHHQQVYDILNKVTHYIQQTAKTMAEEDPKYEEAAAAIDYLMRVNSKGITIRGTRSSHSR